MNIELFGDLGYLMRSYVGNGIFLFVWNGFLSGFNI